MMIILLILATVSARGCRSQPRFNLGPKQLSLLVTHLNHLILTIIKTQLLADHVMINVCSFALSDSVNHEI